MTRICQLSDCHWRGIARHSEYTSAFKLFYKQLREEVKPDLIVNCGDSFHTKTVGLTPEIIQKLAWMFNELADIAPTFTILGQHDGNLTNLNRQSLIVSIHDIIKNPRAVLFYKSGTHKINNKIALSVFSVFDKEGWNNVKPIKGYINIALFHGTVSGCQMENNWRLPAGEKEVAFFKDFDFAFLGDIHRHQFLDYRKDKNGLEKPYIGYPGALIQQNFGESIKKGYLVWDIRDTNDWDVKWKQLANMAPFVTIPWLDTVEGTLENIKNKHGKYAFLPGSRYRVSSSVMIPQVQAKQIIKELKDTHKAFEVTFKSDIISKMDSISAHGVKLSKKSLAQDPEAVTKFYNRYIEAHKEAYPFSQEELKSAANIIQEYLLKLTKGAENLTARNVLWSIKDFKFDNLYGYGENNHIDFERLKNVVGIFGNNRSGKSALIGSLVYTLFNTTDRGPIKNAHIINDIKDHCSGMVRINVGGTDYIIERETERTKSKKGKEKKVDYEAKSSTTVNLWKIRNDNGQEVKVVANGVTRDDTDRIIRRLIGTSEDFLLTAFASQGNLNRFIENKATKRKEVLNRFLELDIFDKLFDFAKADYTALDTRSKAYSAEEWSRVIKRREKEITKSEKQVEEKTNEIDSARSEKDELNLWIVSHEQAAEAADEASIKKLKKQANDTENEITETNSKLEENRSTTKQNKDKIKNLQTEIKKYNAKKLLLDLEAMKKVKTVLSEQKGDSELQLSILETQENAVDNLNKAPCGNNYPDCHFIKDGHAAKQTIKEQRGMVKNISKNIEMNEELLEKYVKQEIENKLLEHDEKVTSIALLNVETTKLITQIEYDIQRISLLQKSFKDSKAKLRSLTASLSHLASEEFTRKSNLLKLIKKRLEKLEREKGQMLLKLGGKVESLQKLKEEREANKDLIAKLRIFESIQSAFSKYGIPAMVLKSQLPAINREMAKILDNLVDFVVTLETDVTSNIMDIYINDGKSKRLVELGSGMEKTICSLALRVALGNLSSLPRPDIFILDESFGALDEDSLQKGMELLSLLEEYFKAVLVITHVAPIKEIADKIIEIKSDGIESSITL